MKVTVTCGETSMWTEVPDDLLDRAGYFLGDGLDARVDATADKIATMFADAYRTEARRVRSAAPGQ